MRSAFGGVGRAMKLVHFRALWVGEKKKELKGDPQQKHPLFWLKVWGFPVGMWLNWREVN